MIKKPPIHARSHSNTLQKHFESIVNLDKRIASNMKSVQTKNYLTPQQKNCILQNGPFLMQFIREKLSIVRYVNFCNDNMTVQHYMNETISQQLRKLKENIHYIRTQILQKYQRTVDNYSMCSQLNEVIYFILNELSQVNLKMKKNLDSLKIIPSPKSNKFDQADEKLKDYFYSFVISLAATESKYHQFLDSLYQELFFDAEFSPEKIEVIMSEDTEYCIRILIIAMTNKFSKTIKDSKFTQSPNVIYFPNQSNFLHLTLNFILTNSKQMTDKFNCFIQKIQQNKTLIETQTLGFNEEQKNENLKNTLSQYLPKQSNSQYHRFDQYIFSPKDLKKIKSKMLLSYNIHTHLEEWEKNLDIFEQMILKICFKRILNCKRHNLHVTQTIFRAIQNAKINSFLMFQGFKQIMNFSESSKHYEQLEVKAEILFNRKLLQRVFKGWKGIKQRKQKILKFLIKKKSKIQKKEQTLMFNLWRINISRMRISQKMLAHSSSCAAVINKFTEDQIEIYENKRHKNTQQIQRSMNKMSGITLKKSNSVKSGFSQSRISHNSKPKIHYIPQNFRAHDLKLLNFQYKNSIVERLNKKAKKDKEKKAINKTQTGTQMKTLLKV